MRNNLIAVASSVSHLLQAVLSGESGHLDSLAPPVANNFSAHFWMRSSDKHWTEVEQRLSANFVLVTLQAAFLIALLRWSASAALTSRVTRSLISQCRPQGADAVIGVS